MNLADASVRLGVLGVDQQSRHELDDRLSGAILLDSAFGEILVQRRVVRIRGVTARLNESMAPGTSAAPEARLNRRRVELASRRRRHQPRPARTRAWRRRTG